MEEKREMQDSDNMNHFPGNHGDEESQQAENPGTVEEQDSRFQAGEQSSTRNVGIDLGYGFVKFIDNEKTVMFPSIVGSGDDIQYQSEMVMETDPLENLHIEIGSESFFVGDLAIRQSEIVSRSLDQDRSKDKNSKVLMLTALNLMCTRDDQQFNVVSGLPTNYYAAYKDDWKNSLTGSYKTSIWREGQLWERNFHIKNARIVPQPFGTLFNLLLNNNGEIVDQDLTREMVGIVDIGYKTTDLAVSYNTEFIDRLSFSTTTALSTISRLIGDKLRREYKVDKEDHMLDECISKKTVKIAGKEHDISAWVDNAFKMVAGKIATEIESKWDFKQFDRILLTGGGGQEMSSYIINSFPNMVLVEEAQFANVRGYQKLAQKIFNG